MCTMANTTLVGGAVRLVQMGRKEELPRYRKLIGIDPSMADQLSIELLDASLEDLRLINEASSARF